MINFKNNEKIVEVNESEYGSESNWTISKPLWFRIYIKINPNLEQKDN